MQIVRMYLSGCEVECFSGVLYKWTSYSKGWRLRWFELRNDGRLSYSKILRQPDTISDNGQCASNSRRQKSVHLKLIQICCLCETLPCSSTNRCRRFERVDQMRKDFIYILLQRHFMLELA
ncbi:hypothetical protein QVD17_37893 [Tagetes erecta]|uniref:PH domain-containing protein n=1 Tax=Tagetes erecta TaxID=13708 RepID=A0AAD8ND39_TARER|nr:hypothetical protein QVD17_37893 [Tagetes erecta]